MVVEIIKKKFQTQKAAIKQTNLAAKTSIEPLTEWFLSAKKVFNAIKLHVLKSSSVRRLQKMLQFLCLYPFLVLILNADSVKKHCFDYIVRNFKLR